jgi:hypothetical protein
MMPSKYGVCLGTILMLSFISSCVSAFSLQTCNANTYTNEHQIVLVPLQLFLEFIDALHDGRQEVDFRSSTLLFMPASKISAETPGGRSMLGSWGATPMYNTVAMI